MFIRILFPGGISVPLSPFLSCPGCYANEADVLFWQKVPPLKALQHSIEDQIYRILRKARIITNIR